MYKKIINSLSFVIYCMTDLRPVLLHRKVLGKYITIRTETCAAEVAAFNMTLMLSYKL